MLVLDCAVLVEQDVEPLPAAETDSHSAARPFNQSARSISQRGRTSSGRHDESGLKDDG